MESKIINNKLELTKRNDQIYIYKTINNCSLDLDTVKEMTKIGDAWNGTELCANLIDIRDVFFIDTKAREYGAKQFRDYVAGQAILIDSKISSYFANLFLKFSRPKVSTKLFTKEDEAIDWLKMKMEKHK